MTKRDKNASEIQPYPVHSGAKCVTCGEPALNGKHCWQHADELIER